MFDVTDNGPLPGLGDLVKTSSADPLNDQTVAEYGRAVATADLPLAQAMSVAGDVRDLLERVLFRTFVRDLDEESCAFPWFECHVPPGGTTAVRSTVTSAISPTFELNIFGSGLGRGRKAAITVSSSSEPRRNCATYSLDLRVKPRLYETRGTESVELEVVACLGKSIVSQDACPYCGVATDAVDQFAFRFGDHLDLRADRVVSKLTAQLAVEDSLSIDAGIKLSSLPVGLKLSEGVERPFSRDRVALSAWGPLPQLHAATDRAPADPYVGNRKRHLKWQRLVRRLLV